MGPVGYFSLCLLGCLIINPSLAASPHKVLSPHSNASLESGVEYRRCPIGWLYYRRYCYGFFPGKMTWIEAEVECQLQHRRSHLASILTRSEGFVVARYIIRSGSKDSVWIGLHNPHHNKCWVWADGHRFRYSAWSPGEPNNKHDEYCTELLKHKGFTKWNDLSCDKKNAFICNYRP